MLDEVHVYLQSVYLLADARVMEKCHSVMNEEELEREQRFRFEKDRTAHCFARGITRSALSSHFPVDPCDWVFTVNRFGRPEIESPKQYVSARFNVSHTDGLVAVALVMNRDIGVDVECVDREVEEGELARRFFAEPEAHDVASLSGKERRDRFFAYWTLKESYIKARGVGLSLSTSCFSFRLDCCGESSVPSPVEFVSASDEDSSEWQFHLSRPTPSHYLALCVRRDKGGGDLKIVSSAAETLWA